MDEKKKNKPADRNGTEPKRLRPGEEIVIRGITYKVLRATNNAVTLRRVGLNA